MKNITKSLIKSEMLITILVFVMALVGGYLTTNIDVFNTGLIIALWVWR